MRFGSLPSCRRGPGCTGFLLALPGENSLWPQAPVGPENSLPFSLPAHYAELLYRSQMRIVRLTSRDRAEWRKWWGDDDVRCPPIVFKSGKEDPLVLADHN